MSTNPYSEFQDLVSELPEMVQPLLVAVFGAIPFIDEAAAGLGVVAGMHPLVAFTANLVASTIAVVLAVLLGSRVRDAIVVRRARRAALLPTPVLIPVSSMPGMTGQTTLATTSAVQQQQQTQQRRN